MNVEMMAVKDIKPFERNAKKHDETQIKNVMESIKQFGMAQPLAVDKDNVLIIGHCRLIACKRLKMDKVPVVKMDELTQEQVDKLRLLDNKLNESEWDFDLLAEDIPTLDWNGFEIDWGVESEIDDIIEENRIDEEVKKNEKGEIPFAEYIDEVSQYVVLKFKTKADWNYANEVFELSKVKTYSTRKDGKENGCTTTGLGRVIDGMDAIKKIENNYKMLHN